MFMPTLLPSPAALIAEIPGILGFHPANSVVFMLLKHTDNCTCSLGPVLRMDVGDTDSLPEIANCINSLNPDVVFAVGSAESPNHKFIGDVVHAGIAELDIKEAALGGIGPHGLCIGVTGSANLYPRLVYR